MTQSKLCSQIHKTLTRTLLYSLTKVRFCSKLFLNTLVKVMFLIPERSSIIGKFPCKNLNLDTDIEEKNTPH